MSNVQYPDAEEIPGVTALPSRHTEPQNYELRGSDPDSVIRSGALLHNLILFGRVLHGLGFGTNPSRMIELQAAFDYVPIGHRRDFYHTLRSLLVKRQEELPLFDEAFDMFWRKSPDGMWENSLDRHVSLQDDSSAPQRVQPITMPQPSPEKELASGLENEEASEDEQDNWETVVELTKTYSAREVLRHKDFSDLTAEEYAAIERMMADLVWQLGRRKTRRNVPGNDGMLDMRRSLRRSLRHGGEFLDLSYRTPKVKPRPLILIADISGSMEHYTRPLLHFMYSLGHGLQQRVETFVFSTRLTCVTRQLRHKNIDQALDETTAVVHDWSGGTRIGDALKTFNYDWGRRVLRGGPVVLIISDGWDRGDPALLYKEMARLHRSCHRMIWLNPLLGSDQYEPLTRGMQAALPHIDDFLPVHNLASLEELARHLEHLADTRAGQGASVRLRGAAFIRGR